MIRAIATLLFLTLTAGCSGISPYQPRNHREEGPSEGFLSGESGQWSIVFPGSDTKQPPAGEQH